MVSRQLSFVFFGIPEAARLNHVVLKQGCDC